MRLVKLIKFNFYKNFFERISVPPFYEEVYNNVNFQRTTNRHANLNKFKFSINITNFIPPFLDLKLNTSEINFGSFKVSTHHGFLINFNVYKDFNDYLKIRLNAKRRKSLRSQQRKLENCFNISVKIFTKRIEKSQYALLFSAFKSMLQKRFKQKGEAHAALRNWNFYEASVNDLLEKKRACLFVIYNEEEPISISLNYIYQNIFIGAFDAYNIDYKKFSLGSLMIFEKIKWCFSNNYDIYDLGWGDLKYKRELCDTVYKFKCHIVYHKNRVSKRFVAYAISRLFILKMYYNQSLVTPIEKFRNKINRNKKMPKYQEQIILTDYFNSTSALDDTELAVQLDLDRNDNHFLKKYKYDFLFRTLEKSKDIVVFKIDSKEYMFKGKRKSCKLIFN